MSPRAAVRSASAPAARAASPATAAVIFRDRVDKQILALPTASIVSIEAESEQR